MSIDYGRLKQALKENGREAVLSLYSEYSLCQSLPMFTKEYVWVICQSGAEWDDARIMEEAVNKAMDKRHSIGRAMDNPLKTKCIQKFQGSMKQVFDVYMKAGNDVERLAVLNWLDYVDSDDVYTFARNLGMCDVYVGNESVENIANRLGEDPKELVEQLARDAGDNIATVESVLAEAESMNIVDSMVLDSIDAG